MAKAASCQPKLPAKSPKSINLDNPLMRYECDAQLLALTGTKALSLFELSSSVIHNLR